MYKGLGLPFKTPYSYSVSCMMRCFACQTTSDKADINHKYFI